jgi:hypothetical protein
VYVSRSYLDKNSMRAAAQKVAAVVHQAVNTVSGQVIAITPQLLAAMSLEQLAKQAGIDLEKLLDFPKGKAIVEAVRGKLFGKAKIAANERR